MPNVNFVPLLTVALLPVLLAGCSEGVLARFAPPGIIKYEDIAGEKPINPAVADAIGQRKEAVDEEFPLIARTPGPKDVPSKPGQVTIDAISSELTAARDDVNAKVDTDRAEALLESESADVLIENREGLDEALQADNEAAARERRDPLTSDKE